jgi:hypothetical protein
MVQAAVFSALLVAAGVRRSTITPMNVAPLGPPAGELARVDGPNRSRLSRLAKAGRALRLTAGLYAVGATLAPEQVAHHHRFDIIAQVWPGGVLCGLTALSQGAPRDGQMFVAHPSPPRTTPLRLPGLTVTAVVGPAALPADVALPVGVFLAGGARALVENVDTQGRRPRHRAGTAAVEDRIDEMARQGGAGAIQKVLTELDVIAGKFDPRAVDLVRERLAAVLGTSTGGIRSPRLAARLSEDPYDEHRLDLLAAILRTLERTAPAPRAEGGPASRWEWQAFFEAYFSNFIEGTEFGVAEARRIAVDGEVPATRPADAHDVAATYRQACDAFERAHVPKDRNSLLESLQLRHADLMAARPDKRPGLFKSDPNYAGGYEFVPPDLVRGTLLRGFDLLTGVTDPFARAVAMMVLITEVHPFDDGNGRIARLAANAELSHAGQVRLVIPTSYRDNYLSALRAISNGHGDGQSLIAVLDFAQRWTAAVDWSSYDAAHAQVEAANGYVPAAEAESSGRRLRFPPTMDRP